VDTLLALRVARTRIDRTCILPQCRDLTHFDPKETSFGSSYVSALPAVSKETDPGTIDAGGRESVIAAVALAYCGIDAKDAERVRKAHRQILCNAFAIGCIDRVSQSPGAPDAHVFLNTQPGKGLYAVASLFNHSCNPNCFVSVRSNPHGCSFILSVRLIRPAMHGEELTISYQNINITTSHSTRARVRALRSAFGFLCKCIACRNMVDEGVKKEEEEHYIKASDYYQKGKRLTREGDYATAVTVLLQSYEIVMKYICPPPRRPQMMLPKTHDALAQAHFLLGEREQCIAHLKEALRLTIELHQCESADMARDYTRLAHLSGDDSYVQKALELLSTFYPPSQELDIERDYVRSAASGN
jgi:hypothetical protein